MLLVDYSDGTTLNRANADVVLFEAAGCCYFLADTAKIVVNGVKHRLERASRAWKAYQ